MAKVLGLAHQKAPDGIMHQMCKPRLAHGDEDPDGGPYWYDDPGRLQQLYNYCAADVACERELYYWLPPLSENEQNSGASTRPLMNAAFTSITLWC